MFISPHVALLAKTFDTPALYMEEIILIFVENALRTHLLPTLSNQVISMAKSKYNKEKLNIL